MAYRPLFEELVVANVSAIEELHPDLSFYEIGGERVFPIYAENGGIACSFLAILVMKGHGRPVRLDGGSLPRRQELFRDPDGWMYQAVEMTNEAVERSPAHSEHLLKSLAKHMVALRKWDDVAHRRNALQRFIAVIRLRQSTLSKKCAAFRAA